MKRKDPDNKSQIVKLVDAFEYKKNYCMVFEKLGLSLYELLKKNDYRGSIFLVFSYMIENIIILGYSIDLIQSFFKQILTSIGFMHANGLTHTDLKVFYHSAY